MRTRWYKKAVLQYLAKLFTFCLASSRAGCHRVPGAPAEFERTTDTVEVILVPLDVMLAYRDRARGRTWADCAEYGATKRVQLDTADDCGFLR